MPIKGPKGAEPTLKGWVNPKTGELLKSQKISQSQVDEWFGVVVEDIIKQSKMTQVEVGDAIEADITEGKIQASMTNQFEGMTKNELEEYGRTVGIELDRRLTKTKLIDNLRSFINAR